MLGKTVLICTDQNRLWRQVSPLLAAAGSRVVRAVTTERAVDLLYAGAVDLMLFHWDSGLDCDAALDAARDRVPVVALVSRPSVEALIDVVCRRGVMHLCAARLGTGQQPAIDRGELVVTVEKILRRDVFGLDKYLTGFGLELSHSLVIRAEDRDQSIEQVTTLAKTMGGSRRLLESVALVADELITNAVYNAPRGCEGQPRYSHLCRRDKVQLEPEEYVNIDFGSDGYRFGLAVTDAFGSLTTKALRRALRRCLTQEEQIVQKAGGAGIGLYTALSCANQLVINSQPGQSTQVVALWDLHRRGGLASPVGASLHMFELEAPARNLRPNRQPPDEQPDAGPRELSVGGVIDTDGPSGSDGGDGVPEPSVSLSDSARVDICRALVGPADPDYRVSLSGLNTLPGEREDVGTILTPRSDWMEQWRQRADLSSLRGVHLLRRCDRPGFDTTCARIRGSTTLGDAIESTMTYLVNWWSSAVLLSRLGDSLLPWASAGDVAQWDELCRLTLPLDAGPRPYGTMTGDGSDDDSMSWLMMRALEPGVTMAPVRRDPMASRLVDLLLGEPGPREGLAMSIGFDSDPLAAGQDPGASEPLMVLFACRPLTARHEDPALYRQLLQELVDLFERFRRSTGPALRYRFGNEEETLTN